MSLNLLLCLAFLILFLGLLCTALSQDAHFVHRRLAPCLNTLGLHTVGKRRAAGIAALVFSAVIMATTEGPGFGLVLWLMTTAVQAVAVAWILAQSR